MGNCHDTFVVDSNVFLSIQIKSYHMNSELISQSGIGIILCNLLLLFWHLPTLSNVEIRCDVTCGRLRISGELPLNARVVWNRGKTHTLYGYVSEMRNLPRVTSCLISKLDREYL